MPKAIQDLTLPMPGTTQALSEKQIRDIEEFAGKRDARGFDTVYLNCGEVLMLIAEVLRWRAGK